MALTLDTYSHELPSMQQEAAAKLDARCRRAPSKIPAVVGMMKIHQASATSEAGINR